MTIQVNTIILPLPPKTSISEVIHTYLQDPLLPRDEAHFEITVLDKSISRRAETYYTQAVEYEKHVSRIRIQIRGITISKDQMVDNALIGRFRSMCLLILPSLLCLARIGEAIPRHQLVSVVDI